MRYDALLRGWWIGQNFLSEIDFWANSKILPDGQGGIFDPSEQYRQRAFLPNEPLFSEANDE